MKQAGLFFVTILVATGALPGEEFGLKGIKSFGVVVEEPPADLAVSKQEVRAYVETLLGIAGLRVVTPAEATHDQTIIDVVVTSTEKRAKSPRALNVQLEVLQPVVLVRDLTTVVPDAITARVAQITILDPASNPTSSVKASVGLLFDLFLTYYRAANP